MVKTMKKILATVLSLAVCLSVLCVPAMASDSTAAHDFPYMLFDFEDGISFTTSSRATIVEGGMGGSGHALKIVEDNTVTCGEYVLLNKWGSNISATIPAGHTFELSFWVKNAAPLQQMQFNLVYGNGNPGASGNPALTDWQKITICYTPTEDSTLSARNLRFGGLGVNTNPLAGCTKAEPGERVYLIDDFEMKILDPNAESDADQIANLDGYKMSFENGVGSTALVQNGYWQAQSEARTYGKETIQVVANPDGRGRVLKYDIGDVAGDGSTLALTTNTDASQWNGQYAPAGTIPVGGTLTFTFKYYFPQEMDSSNNPAFCIFNGNYNAIKWATGSGFATSSNEWHTATLTYTNDGDEEVAFGRPFIRMGGANANNRTWKLANLSEGETYGNRTIYFDDFKMEITSPVDVVATAPASANLIVLGDVAAGNTVRFIHTLAPTSTSVAGVTDASIVRLVNIANDGTAAVINYCGVNQPMVITSIPADSKEVVFEVVPVSSDNKVGNVKEYPAARSVVTETIANTNALPYMLCTYEDGISSFAQGANLTGAFVDGGVGGSGHALKLTTGTSSYTELYIKDKAGNYLTGTIPANSKFVVSFWVKAVTEIAKFDFHIYEGAKYGNYVTEKDISSAVDGWQKVTLKYVPTEDKTISYLRFRQNFVGTYLIDDFEVKLLDPNTKPETDQIASLDGYRMGFENGASMRLMVPGAYHRPSEETSVTNGNETLSIVANPLGNGKVLKIDLTDAQSGNGSLALCDMKASSNNYPNEPVATVPVGSTITYTFKYYFPQEMASDNNPGFCMYHGKGEGYTEKYINSNNVKTTANEWHTAKISWTNNTEADATLKHSAFRICYSENANSFKVATLAEGETQYGNRSIYIDDIAVDVTSPTDATAPVSSNFEVIGTVAVGNGVWFRHTFALASTSAAGTADASIVSLVSYNAAGARNILKTVTVANGMNIPAIPADSAKLVFEVVPMSDDGKVGNVTTYLVAVNENPVLPEEPEEKTTLEYVDGKVKVTAAENINNAYIIFVSYNTNGRMVDYDMAYVNLSAGQSDSYEPFAEEFVTGDYTRAMLWYDLEGCVPLAKAIQY